MADGATLTAVHKYLNERGELDRLREDKNRLEQRIGCVEGRLLSATAGVLESMPGNVAIVVKDKDVDGGLVMVSKNGRSLYITKFLVGDVIPLLVVLGVDDELVDPMAGGGGTDQKIGVPGKEVPG